MKIDFLKAIVAGLLGTGAMTLVATMGGPLVGLPRMDIPGMLASVMAGSLLLGWGAHFMIGTVLALGYTFVVEKLPGPLWVRGATYSIAPWLMAQIVVMPMMGMGFFSGAFALALGSLVGHLVYGTVVGLVYSSQCSSCGTTKCSC